MSALTLTKFPNISNLFPLVIEAGEYGYDDVTVVHTSSDIAAFWSHECKIMELPGGQRSTLKRLIIANINKMTRDFNWHQEHALKALEIEDYPTMSEFSEAAWASDTNFKFRGVSGTASVQYGISINQMAGRHL